MTRAKKLSVLLSLMLMVCLSVQTCFAASWKTINVSKSTSSYSVTFDNEGDILLDFSINQKYINNTGTLKVEKYVNGSWVTAYTSTKDLKVGVYTLFTGNIQNCWGCQVRVTFTSTYSVPLSGSIKYFA